MGEEADGVVAFARVTAKVASILRVAAENRDAYFAWSRARMTLARVEPEGSLERALGGERAIDAVFEDGLSGADHVARGDERGEHRVAHFESELEEPACDVLSLGLRRDVAHDAERKGRSLRPADAERWTSAFFEHLGLHRLRGTVRYPGAA